MEEILEGLIKLFLLFLKLIMAFMMLVILVAPLINQQLIEILKDYCKSFYER